MLRLTIKHISLYYLVNKLSECVSKLIMRDNRKVFFMFGKYLSVIRMEPELSGLTVHRHTTRKLCRSQHETESHTGSVFFTNAYST